MKVLQGIKYTESGQELTDIALFYNETDALIYLNASLLEGGPQMFKSNSLLSGYDAAEVTTHLIKSLPIDPKPPK
jgi:hypothetical protein